VIRSEPIAAATQYRAQRVVQRQNKPANDEIDADSTNKRRIFQCKQFGSVYGVIHREPIVTATQNHAQRVVQRQNIPSKRQNRRRRIIPTATLATHTIWKRLSLLHCLPIKTAVQNACATGLLTRINQEKRQKPTSTDHSNLNWDAYDLEAIVV
jgi:hypothetical protein